MHLQPAKSTQEAILYSSRMMNTTQHSVTISILLDQDFLADIALEDPWRPQFFATGYKSPEWYPNKALQPYVWTNRVHTRKSQTIAECTLRIIMQIRHPTGISMVSAKFWFDRQPEAAKLDSGSLTTAALNATANVVVKKVKPGPRLEF
jgi:hypothetical protein